MDENRDDSVLRSLNCGSLGPQNWASGQWPQDEETQSRARDQLCVSYYLSDLPAHLGRGFDRAYPRTARGRNPAYRGSITLNVMAAYFWNGWQDSPEPAVNPAGDWPLTLAQLDEEDHPSSTGHKSPRLTTLDQEIQLCWVKKRIDAAPPAPPRADQAHFPDNSLHSSR